MTALRNKKTKTTMLSQPEGLSPKKGAEELHRENRGTCAPCAAVGNCQVESCGTFGHSAKQRMTSSPVSRSPQFNDMRRRHLAVPYCVAKAQETIALIRFQVWKRNISGEESNEFINELELKAAEGQQNILRQPEILDFQVQL